MFVTLMKTAFKTIGMTLGLLLAIPLGIILMFVAGQYVFAWSGLPVKHQIRQYRFEVPQENASSAFWFSLLFNIPRDKSPDSLDGRTFGYVIPVEQVRKALPDYQDQGIDDIRGVVQVMIPRELDYYHSRIGDRDMWLGSGSYRERIIEKDERTGLYKMFVSPNSRFSWEYLTKEPDTTVLLPPDPEDYLVASCTSSACLGFLVMDDISINFYVHEYNVAQIGGIKAMLRDRVKFWIKPAPARP